MNVPSFSNADAAGRNTVAELAGRLVEEQVLDDEQVEVGQPRRRWRSRWAG